MENFVSTELPHRSEYLAWTETILLAVINVTAFFGNLSVCYAVYSSQRLRTLPNVFVVALAVSDILISTCSTPFAVVTLYRGRWIFGSSVCLFQGFATFNFAMASLGTMGIIAVSRYFCVVKPQKYMVLFTKRRILMYIASVWLVAPFGSIPPLFFDEGKYEFQPAKAQCLYSFEANIPFSVFIDGVFIAIPLTIITVCYAKVFYTVSQSNRVFSLENNLHQLRANVEEAKVTKTLVAVMVGFAICWLPICVIDFVDTARGEPTLPRQTYLTYAFLIYSSSTINPFIYGTMNRYFRQAFKASLKRAFCLHA